MSHLDRARGALAGLALGDAYGMPTQSMSPAAIRRDYGTVDALVDAGPHQVIAHGMPAGSVTDDTEQALLVAELLVRGRGNVEPAALAQALRRWEESMRRRGSLDLLGPSSRAAIEALADGADPRETGRNGATNGAAMRVAPVGIATATSEPEPFIDAVAATCLVTHNTGLAISGAVAVAAVVSAGIDGRPMADSLDVALRLADDARGRGHWFAGASVADRTRWAQHSSAQLSETEFSAFLTEVIGTSVQTQESVVAALLLADRYAEDPRRAVQLAAMLGGDTDTIAAMAGAMIGAHVGYAALPQSDLHLIASVSQLDLTEYAEPLLALRSRHAASPSS